MDFKEYRLNVLKTESLKPLSGHPKYARFIHAAMGLSTEANEILDVAKKSLFYTKPVDIKNLKEEAGDLLWYLTILLEYLETDMSTIMELNIKKLSKRYPNQEFSEEKANKRDIDNELSHF